MLQLEQWIIQLLLTFTESEALNLFLRDPQNTATLVGVFIAIAGALLGTFLLLRGMSLTSDAISHTVLLGIVVAFMVMTFGFGQEPDLTSVWLIIGATAAGVATVILTELIYRSGLVKQDAALGLAFPLLFALAVILVSRFIDDVHLDEDAVMVGEIGVAWANTNSHCLENCATVTINPGEPLAETTRQCTNCRALGISPRDEGAEFVETCTNCGEYSPAQAWQAGLIQQKPIFVILFYKELKLSTFDAALAEALGFRPTWLNYGLMVMVSLVAVGAFDAVGSILVIAFFIIPPTAAYLLTDRLPRMLFYSALMGAAGAYFGYDLARGNFLGLVEISNILAGINRLLALDLMESWNSSISASMVLMLFFFFLLAWIFSPKYGLVSTLFRQSNQRRNFDYQVILGHIYHHQGQDEAHVELAADTLYEHFHWSPGKMQRVLGQLRALSLVQIQDGDVALTQRGQEQVLDFRETQLASDVIRG